MSTRVAASREASPPAQSALPGIFKAAREEKGLTTRALADAVGIDHSMVTKIETGKKAPGNELLAKLAGALGLRLADWMRDASTSAAAPREASDEAEASDQDVIRVPLAKLAHDLANPRTMRDLETVAEFAASIEAKGVLIPLLARPPQDASDRYTVFDGGTRLAALHLLRDGGAIDDAYLVPVKVRAIETAEAVLEALVVGKREDLNPMDECEAFRLLSDGGLPVAFVASALGLNPRTVQLRLQVARQLVSSAKAMLRHGQMTLAQAEALAGAELERDQDAAISAIAAGTLRTEAQVRDYLAGLKSQRLAEKERQQNARFKSSRPGDMARRPDRREDDDLEPPPGLDRRGERRQPDLVDKMAEAGAGAVPSREASENLSPEQRWNRTWRNALGGIDDAMVAPGDFDGPPASIVLTNVATGKRYRFVFDAMEIEHG